MITDKDVLGLELGVPFAVQIPGRIVLEDGAAAPEWNLQARRATSYARPLVASDGSFLLRLSEGSYQVVLADLPAGYTVRSMTYGAVDLMQSSLEAAPGKPLSEIRITVGKK